MTVTRKKLIEVALPLDAINAASAREKSIRHGHPSTLHLWWARRPLAAARAVIFSQMVDDPSACPEEFPTEEAQEAERQRLFRLIEQLVLWENTTNETVLQAARDEIWKSWRRTCHDNRDDPRAAQLYDPVKLPAFHDPFAGGGALPLEAQRLGLEAHASDLNPVAVLINKAMIEIPPKFAGMPPVNPESRKGAGSTSAKWKGAAGLAEDVRYYGKWMRDEAEERIGNLYPKVAITAEMVAERPDLKQYLGRELTVIAWIWARTVKSPNPAFANVDVPLASTFMLSTKVGKEAYVEPVIGEGGYRFTVKVGKPKDAETAKNGTKLSRGANFRCLMSSGPIESAHIYAEALAGRMGARLMAIVAEGDRGRVYLTPTDEVEAVARTAMPSWKPDLAMPENPRWFSPPLYGLTTYGDLFTDRQLVALTTFSDLVGEAREQARTDALAAGLPDDPRGIDAGGRGATAYADAVSVYLAMAVSKQADLGNSLCRWEPVAQCPRQLFGRQAIPMIWDFAEGNPLGSSSGAWNVFIDGIVRASKRAFESVRADPLAFVQQQDAVIQALSKDKVVSTDPPYYDNIGYADLSDFFYVWLRRSLGASLPGLFATLATPKDDELVATPYRHGGKEGAERFFLTGMTAAMRNLATHASDATPITIYYAFKQNESAADVATDILHDSAGPSGSTGWQTFLDAVIGSGLTVAGTWPMRTENASRMIGQGTNALASSIVLVCRPRQMDGGVVPRRDFESTLKREMPIALRLMQLGSIAPVDLGQAAIGPGIAIYTRYLKVLEADGSTLSVRTALQLINQVLDELLSGSEGSYDDDTRFAIRWFEQLGHNEGVYGTAETLATSTGVAVAGVAQAGIIESRGGKVRLLRREELPADWNPETDTRITTWEVTQHLVHALEHGGEVAAADLLARCGPRGEDARDLAYRLFAICEKKGWAQEALAYNALAASWSHVRQAAESRPQTSSQPSML